MGNSKEGTQQNPQEANLAASGEITATDNIQHLTEAVLFLNKAGLFRQKKWNFD